MYKCARCGRVMPPEKEKVWLSPDWRDVKCSCGSRTFVKARPQRIKRVRAV